MKFHSRKNICPNCLNKYDDLLLRCPSCQYKNTNRPKPLTSNFIFFVESWRQLLLFLVGFVGFQILGIIIQLILIPYAKEVCPNNESFSLFVSMLTNSISYTIILCILTGIMYPFLKDLFKCVDKRKILYGIVGGIVLILVSMFYSAFINVFYNTSGNANQQVTISMVDYYPLASLLLLGIIGPIVEEFTYRVGVFGFFYRINKILAYILTILIFAFIHFDFTCFGNSLDSIIIELINIPSYIFAGAILCFVFEKSSWAGSCISHIINNSFSVIMMILASWVMAK